MKKRRVADPKAYMQTNHPTALILETHAVKESIWSIVDASVEDTIANLSWIDIRVRLLSSGDSYMTRTIFDGKEKVWKGK